MNENSIEIIGETPDIQRIKGELETSLLAAGPRIQQMQRDYDVRFCKWPGQSDDGRKHAEMLGETPFPWEGASDTKIRAADEVVNEHVAIMTAAFAEAKIQAVATNLDSVSSADSVTTLMRWLFRTQMRAEVALEVELAAQWRQTYGMAVLGVFWEQTKRLTTQTVTLEELQIAAAEAAAQGETGPLELLEKLFDPLAREELVQMAVNTNPILDTRQARKLLDELATDGVADMPEVAILNSKPRWLALRPWIDVFFPAHTKDLRAARWVARRRFLTEAEMREQAEAEGWDEDWMGKVIDTAKGTPSEIAGLVMDWSQRRTMGTPGFYYEEFKDYIEVIDWYQHGIDEKTQAPALYHTVFCPSVTEEWAKHELFAYKHGEMPFVALVRERTDLPMLESRSVPEIAASAQAEIKVQRDARSDYASIATMPPLIVPPNKGKVRLQFGPGVQHTESRSGAIRWMQPPQSSPASKEAEMSARSDLDRYFGRFSAEVPQVISQAFLKKLVRDFLGELSQAAVMTLQLCQQYLPETTVERVAGANRVPVMLSREDIRGQFIFTMTFDVEQLDPALVKEKLELWNTFVLGADTLGVADRGKYVKYAARLVSPEMADELISDPQATAQNETEDEKAKFAEMVSGSEPDMKPAGQNFQLRLQTLLGIVQANPEVQQMIKGRPVLQAMVENRIKHFQFMIQQTQVNPQIGRIGAKPVLGEGQPQ
ncbi:MAG: hypothetical protein ACFUZC_04930 [Chthoniobacteraceae bacterium]